MENNKSDLTNPVFAENAQTDSSPELSSLIEEMKNGIDLQPLEDMDKGDMIEFEDMSTVETEKSGGSAHDRKAVLKKRVLCILLTAVALGVAVFGGYNAYLRLVSRNNPATAVYQKGNSYYISLDDEKKIKVSDVVEARLSADGSVLIYSQNDPAKTGKFNIK